MTGPRRGTPADDALACPACKSGLRPAAGSLSCDDCGRSYPQRSDAWVDLLPRDLLAAERGWADRQRQMEAWYSGLLARPSDALRMLERDYEPYAALLGELSGAVLDVGGGIGAAGRYLPREATYVVVDPSVEWLREGWRDVGARLGESAAPGRFVCGVGEYLPFADESFDAAISFWSINHATRPEAVFGEVSRVLRRGGRFFVVLEDMPPRWGELRGVMRRFATRAQAAKTFGFKLLDAVPGLEWPVAADHVRIRESDVRDWAASRFAVDRRAWIDRFLTYSLSKL